MASAVESGKTFSLDFSLTSVLTGGAVAGIGDPSVKRRLGAFDSDVVVVG